MPGRTAEVAMGIVIVNRLANATDALKEPPHSKGRIDRTKMRLRGEGDGFGGLPRSVPRL